jgi:hypothetical protein
MQGRRLRGGAGDGELDDGVSQVCTRLAKSSGAGDGELDDLSTTIADRSSSWLPANELARVCHIVCVCVIA